MRDFSFINLAQNNYVDISNIIRAMIWQRKIDIFFFNIPHVINWYADANIRG